HITASSAITIVLLSVLLLEPLHQVAAFFYIGMGGKASEKAIGRWFDEAPEHVASHGPVASTGDGSGAMTLRDVTVGYGDSEILHGVDLVIPRGSRTAIVGRSGAGKSTLLGVMTGTLPAHCGQVVVDGLDAELAEAGAIRGVSASVNQRTWLFAGTIADNLAVANPDATPEQMWEALRRADVADDVASMPCGLDSDVGEQGCLLSGGQAQRISLARAFLSGRKILLLDEPTSHVDMDSEQRIIDAISRIGDDTTVVMVTHRRRLLDLAHDVYRVADGTLVPVSADEVNSEDLDRVESEDRA
ncbi:MAG: ATP-binding cassette domain-containing protein, partial [Cutibacterium avidum]|nr:ATP-binding cassette domain-containing protein [Cutibacterium avidum]